MVFYLGEQMSNPPDPDKRSPEERRQYKRRFVNFSVRYKFQAEGVLSDWKSSEAGNVSAGGLFMTFGEDIHMGKEFDLEFSVPGKTRTIIVKGIVKWVKVVVPGAMVECGLEFVAINPEDKAFLDAFAHEGTEGENK